MKKKIHTGLAVLESRWDDDRNLSIREIFNLISDIHTNSSHSYDYEMVNSRVAFIEAFRRYRSLERTNYLSIHCHGNEQGLCMSNKDSISRAILRNCLKGDENRYLSGLHIGACSFINSSLVEFLYCGDISPWWIAGYGKDIDFIESTGLDFIFFHKLISFNGYKKLSEIDKIRIVSNQMSEEMPGLIKKLDFCIFYYEDNSKEVIDMLSDSKR